MLRNAKMSDARQYYEPENEKVKERVPFLINEIRQIVDESAETGHSGKRGEFKLFFRHTGSFILNLLEYEDRMDSSYFEKTDLEGLKRDNALLYSAILPQNYDRSYGNPSYCVERMGNRFGQAFSFFYVKVRQSIRYAFEHKLFKIVELCEVFKNLDDLVRADGLEYETLLATVAEDARYPNTRDFVSLSCDWNLLRGDFRPHLFGQHVGCKEVRADTARDHR